MNVKPEFQDPMFMRWLNSLWKTQREHGVVNPYPILNAIDELLGLLSKSVDSSWATATVRELTEQVAALRRKIEAGEDMDLEIRELFAPTGPLQEASIDNGWGKQFLELARRIEID